MPLQTILMYVGIVFIVIGVVCIGLAAYMFFVRDVRGAQADLSGKGRYRGSSDKNAPLRQEVKRHKAVTGSLAKDSGDVQAPKSASGAKQQPSEPKKPAKNAAAKKEPSFDGDDSSTGSLESAGAISESASAAQTVKAEEKPAAVEHSSVAPSASSAPLASAEQKANQSQAAIAAEPVEFSIVRKIVLRESTGLNKG